MELKLKEPNRLPLTISEEDFQTFVESIHIGTEANRDPTGFRDRLLCLMLKEGGFRIGDYIGMCRSEAETILYNNRANRHHHSRRQAHLSSHGSPGRI